jgi:hypothetical protein
MLLFIHRSWTRSNQPQHTINLQLILFLDSINNNIGVDSVITEVRHIAGSDKPYQSVSQLAYSQSVSEITSI